MAQTDKRAAVTNSDHQEYQRTELQKEMILYKLREKGCRITRQRKMLLDIILEGECSCCKEIYYEALKHDSSIGTATVYRMVNTLEELGAISRKNMYQVTYNPEGDKDACTIELSDDTVCHLSENKWNEVLMAGLRSCGYLKNQQIRQVNLVR